MWRLDGGKKRKAVIPKPRYKRGLIRRYSGNNAWYYSLT